MGLDEKLSGPEPALRQTTDWPNLRNGFAWPGNAEGEEDDASKTRGWSIQLLNPAMLPKAPPMMMSVVMNGVSGVRLKAIGNM